MTTYDDNQVEHRRVIQEVFPELSEAQVVAVHALWKYGRGGAEGEWSLRQYLAQECGVSDGEKIQKMFRLMSIPKIF